MPQYLYECPDGHVTEAYGGYDDVVAPCVCGGNGRRLPCSGVQVINRTGDIGRPVTWEEKRQREDNAYTQERVTNNSKHIQKETGQKHGAGLR
jgi:hypothetical protein